jgi:hypothetical protein
MVACLRDKEVGHPLVIDRTSIEGAEMAKLQIENVRLALAKDGTVTVPEAENMAVGQVMRDPTAIGPGVSRAATRAPSPSAPRTPAV